MISNYELRQKAHKALWSNLPIILVVALIAILPSLISSTIVVMTGSDLNSYAMNLAMDSESVVYTGTVEDLMAEMTAFTQEKGWINTVTTIVSNILAPVLQLGLMAAILNMLRGTAPEVGMAFSRLGSFVKSVLLSLLVNLKVLLWALPGMAVMIVGSVITLTTGESAALILMLAGTVAMAVMMVRAAYSYAMSTLILADEPGEKVRACIRRSKGMMTGKRGQLFLLEMTYIIWNMLASMISGMLGGVIGSTISMALQLVVMAYMTTARCAFYDAHRVQESV